MKRCVLVTGGARNTGLAIVRRFARAGCDVVISGRDVKPVEPVARAVSDEFGVDCRALTLDQGNSKTVEEAFFQIDEWGFVVETMVCNAANAGIGQPIIETPLDEWAAVIDTNVVGTFAVAREAVRRMVDNEVRGCITFVASNQARRGVANRSAYSASKGALSALCKVFAVELGEFGIRTNCLMPGRVRTAVFDRFDDEAVKQIVDRVPLRTLVQEDEVAEAAFFLAQPGASSITGLDFVIDGGCDAQMFSS